MNNARLNALTAFVGASLHKDNIILKSLNGDASFRQYFRFDDKIIINSPPDTQKNYEFYDINKRLEIAGLLVPKILFKDLDNGFFITEDLGDCLFYEKTQTKEIETYYKRAIDTLIDLTGVDTKGLPLFDKDFILFELNICNEWCLDKYLHLNLTNTDKNILNNSYLKLVDICQKQKQCAMHRDYHCRNIMLKDNKLYLIDFQDMVLGPILYDLASLLFDCYIKLDDALVDRLTHYAYDKYKENHLLDISYDSFLKTLKLTSLQRHIKVLGIFLRLSLRDGKNGYLKDLPRVLNYVLDEITYDDSLKALGEFFKEHVQGHLPCVQ